MTDPDKVYVGAFRQATWGNLPFEVVVVIMMVVTNLFVITQNWLLTLGVGGLAYASGVLLSLKDPFYLKIVVMRYFKLPPSRTVLFWRGARRYMP